MNSCTEKEAKVLKGRVIILLVKEMSNLNNPKTRIQRRMPTRLPHPRVTRAHQPNGQAPKAIRRISSQSLSNWNMIRIMVAIREKEGNL